MALRSIVQRLCLCGSHYNRPVVMWRPSKCRKTFRCKIEYLHGHWAGVIAYVSFSRNDSQILTMCVLTISYSCKKGELFDYLTEVVTLSEKRTRYCIIYHRSSTIIISIQHYHHSILKTYSHQQMLMHLRRNLPLCAELELFFSSNIACK